MKTAVVILNWNGVEMLAKFLPSVVKHSMADDVCIYVADNGSTDNSVKFLEENYPTIKLLVLDDNYGFAEGYNKAIKQIEAEYVVLLNSDVEVTEGWIEPIIELMDRDSTIAACQPKILSQTDKTSFEYAGASGGYIDKYGYPFCRGRVFNSLEKDLHQYDTVVDIFWASGAAMFIRRSEYIDNGGLDGRFFAHMEEIDLCWRIRSSGKRICCVPQSVVYHVGGGTLSAESPRKTFLNFRNNLLMLYKNLPELELKSVMRVRMLLDHVAMLVFVAKGEISKAKAVINARREYKRLVAEYKKDREKNMNKATTIYVKERIDKSIVWQFYVKGAKTFDKLFV